MSLRGAPYLLALAVLLPFLGKAFHIDDALFIYVAGYIRAHPFAYPFPPGILHANPPGQFWFVALGTALFGESEPLLHLFGLPLIFAALWGMTKLAEELHAPGPLSALLVVCNACFVVSASTLMPDAHMLGLLLPALALLWWDAREPSPGKLALATLLFALGWTLRTNGLPVLLLAGAVQLAKKNRRALLPVAAALGSALLWNLWTRAENPGLLAFTGRLVGEGLPTARFRLFSLGIALCTCTLVPLLFALLTPAAWLERAGILLVFVSLGPVPRSRTIALCGLGLLALGLLLRVRRGRALKNPDDLFLILWALGGFAVPVLYNAFSPKFLNLSVPPLILLVLRHAKPAPRRTLAAAAVGLACALGIGVADLHYAGALRDATLGLAERAQQLAQGHTAWLASHKWGAWVYARQAGLRTADVLYPPEELQGQPNTLASLQPGDVVIDLAWPGEMDVPRKAFAFLEAHRVDDAFPLRVMESGAGYWSTGWGDFPVVWSRSPQTVARLFRVVSADFRRRDGTPFPRPPEPSPPYIPLRW